MSVEPNVRDSSHNNRVKAGEKFPPYDPERKCPACGHDDVKTSYRHDGCGDADCATCPRRHLLRICQRCHANWPEAVAS